MKGKGSKIYGHMVRDARINNPVQKGIKSGGMDCCVGIRCSEGWERSMSRSGQKRVEC